jgi:hypothetical protein
VEIIKPAVAAIIAVVIGTRIAILTFSKVRKWLSRHEVPQGTGEIISERLATGQYSVVCGVFSSQENMVAEKRWTAQNLDGALAEGLRKGGGKIVVRF